LEASELLPDGWAQDEKILQLDSGYTEHPAIIDVPYQIAINFFAKLTVYRFALNLHGFPQ
jgi:hypothetical protein